MLLQDFSDMNLQRCLSWHPAGLGSWSMSDWAVALLGEVGEVCEVIADDALPHSRAAVAPEIGDVFAYLDLFTRAAHLDVVQLIHEPVRAARRVEGYSPEWWGVVLSMHAGKLCDVVKKLNRCRDNLCGNRVSEAELREELKSRIARLATLLTQFAAAQGLDVAECARVKFNAVSERLGFPERL